MIPSGKKKLAPEEILYWIKVSYPRGSIAAAFEQTPEFRFDSFLTGQETRHLYKKGYWLSPNNDEIRPDDDIEPEYEVVDGRFVELPKHDGECFCIRWFF